MKQLGCISVALLSCLVLCAQPSAERKQGKLEGVVTDSGGTPLSGVNLKILPNFTAATEQGILDKLPPQPIAQSDERGRFVFPDIPPALYHLSAEKPGYLTQAYGGKPGDSAANAGAPIEVREGPAVSALSLSLTRMSVVTGRVVTDDGEPLGGIPVDAVTWTFVDGRRRLEVRGSSDITDDKGEFRITGLPPGQVFLYADSKPPGPPRPGSANVGLFPTYYPNALEITGAAKVQLFPGSEAHADIRMRRDRVFTARGTVLGPSGQPLAGSAVFLLRDDEGPFVPDRRRQTKPMPPIPYNILIRTGPDGRFELKGILPGTHRVVAFGGASFQLNAGAGRTLNYSTGPGSPGDGANGAIDITVREEDVEGVEIRLQPPSEVTLRLDTGEFEQLMRERLKRRGLSPGAINKPTLILEPETSVALIAQFPGRAEEPSTKPVGPGRYQVKAQSELSHYWKSVRLGGEDFTTRPIEFSGGSATLEVVMAFDGGQVSGSVANSKNARLPAINVSLWPVIRNGALFTGGALTTITGPDGTFTIASVPPGEYFLASFEDLPDPGLATYFDFLAPFAGDAKRIKVEPNGAVSMSLEPIPASTTKAAAERLP